jgi:hypothetical protein
MSVSVTPATSDRQGDRSSDLLTSVAVQNPSPQTQLRLTHSCSIVYGLLRLRISFSRLLTRTKRTRHQTLIDAGSAEEWTYLPCSGLVSLQTITEDAASVEVALIGREGIVGLYASDQESACSGQALGLQRTGATAASIALQDLGAIKARHGRITILDRRRMESAAENPPAVRLRPAARASEALPTTFWADSDCPPCRSLSVRQCDPPTPRR